jgi:hypothetical protein
MKLFIIGATQTGKTTLAQAVASELEMQALSASEWAKLRFKRSELATTDRDAYVREITDFTCTELAKQWDSCARYLQSRCTGSLVIEGIRNPYDFSVLFDPHEDAVVFLLSGMDGRTTFEKRGLAAIQAQVTFYVDTGILNADRVYWLKVAIPLEEESIDELVTWALGIKAGSIETRNEFVHADVGPIPCFVSELALYNNDPNKTAWVKGEIFSFSSYPGHAPTFNVLLDTGAVFSYIPCHLVRTSLGNSEPGVENLDLVYHNCPIGPFTINKFKRLAETPCTAHFKRTGKQMRADYLFTVDWWAGNDLFHCLALTDGRIAFLPSHKVLFGDDTGELPDYKKLHGTWTAG